MADFLLSSNNLRHSLSFNPSRHFPLSPPHSNLSFIRFISFRRTRLSPSSLLTKLSSDSSPVDIISTTELPDGSIVFKFGDASEIPQIEEPANTSDGEVDVNDSKIIVVGISNGEHDDVSTAEDDVSDDAKKEVLEASDSEHEASEATSELLVEKLKSESEVKLEGESVTDEELPEFDENSVDKETELQETAPKIELSGLSGETEESSSNSVDNLQSIDQLNGASNCIEDEGDQDSVSKPETENSDDSLNEIEVGEQGVEVVAAVIISDSSTGLKAENSEEISHGEAVAVLSTSELETAEVSSHVDDSETTLLSESSELDSNGKHMVTEGIDIDSKQSCSQSLESIELDINANQVVTGDNDSNVKHVVTEDKGSREPLEIEKNSLVEASGVAVSLEHSELDSDVKDVVSEINDSAGQPSQSEAEPMLVEEGSNNSVNDVVEVKLASETSLVNDDAPSTLAQHDDDSSARDILEVASSEASGMPLAEINLESINDVEISTPTLSLSSAAASLPHQSEALAGGVDAYFVCQNWFGVADGVGQWSLGGINEGQYAQELMQNCERLATNNQNAELKELKEVFQQSAAMTQSAGSARVLIAHFADQALHVVNIGDSGFIVIRNGAVFQKSSPMVHEFSFPYAISSGDDPLEAAEEYHIDLEDGDLIITATDGLFDNLYEQEIASIVYKSMGAGMELKDLAELLVAKAQEVGQTPSARTPFADAAQAAGHTGYKGGKLDHVTVIVSLVQKA